MFKNIASLAVASLVVAAISAHILGYGITRPEEIGFVIGMALASVGIAVILVGIPAGIYWLFKRKLMPGFSVAIWVIWALVAVLSLIGNLM
jgi:hypothetical protein